MEEINVLMRVGAGLMIAAVALIIIFGATLAGAIISKKIYKDDFPGIFIGALMGMFLSGIFLYLVGLIYY